MSEKPVRLPDLHAPRYRHPVAGTLNKTTYALLRQQVPAVESLSDVQLKDLVLSLNELLWQTLLQQADGVELPGRTGHLFLAACPGRRGDSTDYKSSRELGERVRHRNWESDGFLAKVIFTSDADRYHFKHHELYGFKACRKFRQGVGEQFPRQWQLYTQLAPDRRLKGELRDKLKVLAQLPEQARSLLEYDELRF